MSTNKYVLAKDEDFESFATGGYMYIGKEPYVKIPVKIRGKVVNNYDFMFRCSYTLEGVSSSNGRIKSAKGMFSDCNLKELDLSEFNMSAIEDITDIFFKSELKTIIWPKDKMPLNLLNTNRAFARLCISELDLSFFNFSTVLSSVGMFTQIKVRQLKFPQKNLTGIVKPDKDSGYYPLEYINSEHQTEELCWSAVLMDKTQEKYIYIRSKRILLFLGTDYPDYVEFYHRAED